MKKNYIYILAMLALMGMSSCEKDIVSERGPLEVQNPTKLKYEEKTFYLPFDWGDYNPHHSGKPIENDTATIDYLSYKMGKVYKLTNNDQDTIPVEGWKVKISNPKTGVITFLGRNFAGGPTMLEGKYQADVMVNTTGGRKTFKGVWTFNLIKRHPTNFSYPDSTYTIPVGDGGNYFSKLPVIDKDLKLKFYFYYLEKAYKLENNNLDTIPITDASMTKVDKKTGLIKIKGNLLGSYGEGNYGVDVKVQMKNNGLDEDPPKEKIYKGAWNFEIKQAP